MIERTINISGKDVLFRSSATVPRLYRAKFKRDIFKDLKIIDLQFLSAVLPLLIGLLQLREILENIPLELCPVKPRHCR